jgi:hypothetical protein
LGDSQYAAMRDDRSKIAGRQAKAGSRPKPSSARPFGAINLLKMRTIRVINCRRLRKKPVRDIL